MSPVNTNDLREALQAADRAALLHLHDPNVSLIDVGWRIHDRKNYRVGEELCVRVHLRRKLRGREFEQFAARSPDRVIVPDRIGFSVDLPGEVNYRPHWWGYPTASRHGRVFNSLCGGISISNAMVHTYGTLGGLVRDRMTGAPMILSNWHVLAGPWSERPGLPIYQPGRMDGGHAGHTVATLTRHAMDQNIDAAVATLTGVRPLINDQLDIGPVMGVVKPELGMQVKKSGRGTDGITKGIVTGFGGRMRLPYYGMWRIVREYVHIAPMPEGGQVSAGGDSGSWWLDAETKQAVALHFGGSDYPEYGLAISMPVVLKSLDVDIVTETQPILRTVRAQPVPVFA